VISSEKETSVSGASDDLVSRATQSLAATPVTIVLDTLTVHPGASSWVQSGQHLHEGTDTCIFCGAPLTEERRFQIEQHFSNEVANRQGGFRALASDLRTLVVDADSVASRIPNRGLLFDDLREGFDSAAAQLRGELTALKTWAAELQERVNAKAANVLAAVSLRSYPCPL